MRRLVPIAALALALLTPAAARADTYITPFAGVTFGGASQATTLTYGASIAFLGRWVGVEVDFSRTPEFFPNLTREHRMTTAAGRFVFGFNARTRPIRPFASVGAGLLRISVESPSLFPDFISNDVAIDAGGGVHAFFFDRAVGIRVDVRYVRKILEQEDTDGLIPVTGTFAFWRGTIGAAFLF
jgi:hypothetical protein